jgi:hypothetical protein
MTGCRRKTAFELTASQAHVTRIGDVGVLRRHLQFSERDTQSHVLATPQRV